ncbi:hypothetical protein Taro_047450 [Colocasia esculenta]|uniref:Short-chain dehydrogenase TIC 32, chloroplastic n=1 Tax=Colocasia esculenta TaxID=4460 RepID=A0A843X0W0_COLES|nr:hypothetical protein [Colocasia esculenta]
MGLWNWFWRPGPSGFGSSSTAEQVTEGIDASHLTAIVTGATSGIGKETARVLALRGAKVIIPARTLEAGAKAKESLLEANPAAKIDVMEMDLGSLKSVESFARSFVSSSRPLNILINNAGIMWCPFQLSRDGIELQFATNHLGHFLLTKLLLDKMKSTGKETGIQGRIVNVSSDAHRRADGSWLSLDTINDQSKSTHSDISFSVGSLLGILVRGSPLKGSSGRGDPRVSSQYSPCSGRYQGLRAYDRSKLANILHANELSRGLQEEGANLTVNSLHPGVIFTNIARYLELNAFLLSLATLAKPLARSVPQGAATTCYLALHPGVKDVSGKYFANCNEETPTRYARDRDLAKKLWDLSEELVEKSRKPA